MRFYPRRTIAWGLSFAVLAGLAACEPTRRSSRGSDDDSDGSGSTGNGSSGSGAGSQGAGSGSGGQGGDPSCKMGGQPCEGYLECCSGECANQICTACAGNGDSCATAECCGGLSCYEATETCGTCENDGELCTFASDCCSNVCDDGHCGAPQATDCSVGTCEGCYETACAESACSSEFAACDGNPECVALMDCLAPCTTTDCAYTCYLTHQTGMTEGQPLATCLCAASVCGTDCSLLCSALGGI